MKQTCDAMLSLSHLYGEENNKLPPGNKNAEMGCIIFFGIKNYRHWEHNVEFHCFQTACEGYFRIWIYRSM
jgi:uncharacterized Fe-S center protein